MNHNQETILFIMTIAAFGSGFLCGSIQSLTAPRNPWPTRAFAATAIMALIAAMLMP